MYTVARMIADMQVIAKEASSTYFLRVAMLTAEEALGIFLTNRFPWTKNEGAFNTIAPYNVGTIGVVNDSKTVQGIGTTWDLNWPTPALLRPSEGAGQSFLITSFDQDDELTIDKEWPFDTDVSQTYSIEFPSYDLPSYITIDAVQRSRLTQWVPLTPSTRESLLAKRNEYPAAFYPQEYFVTPSNGSNSQKIWLWPAPVEVQTMRYVYNAAMPEFRFYNGDGGSATLNNAAAAVTGVGTTFLKLGYSLEGMMFEFQDFRLAAHVLEVEDVTTDTAMALASNFQGPSQATQPFYVSPRILIPDDAKAALRALMRYKYFEDVAPGLAPAAKLRYSSLVNQAWARAEVTTEARLVTPLGGCEPELYKDEPPAIPYLIQEQP